MGCKADFPAVTQQWGAAIGKKFDAADGSSPDCHGPRGVVQRVQYPDLP